MVIEEKEPSAELTFGPATTVRFKKKKKVYQAVLLTGGCLMFQFPGMFEARILLSA